MEFKEISILKLQQLQLNIEKKYALVVPTYTMNLASGGKQVVEHDADSIKDDKTPQDEKDAWAIYQAALSRMNEEIIEKRTAYIFYKGVECEIVEEWLEEQAWLGVAFENERDMKVNYVTTELFKTPLAIKEAMFQIMKISSKGVDESAIEAAEATFRSS